MKIKKIKWSNHPVLGNLELDFTNNSTGIPYDNIILAGENGTGKTTILESLAKFLNLGSFEYFDYIEYIVDGQHLTVIPPDNRASLAYGFHKRLENEILRNIDSNKNNNRNSIDSDVLDLRHYGCVFSKARADYKTNKITTTSTKNIDTDKYDEDNIDDFTSLKQLIVDVYSQDTQEYAEINKIKGNNPITWEEFYVNSKLFRFQNAFDNFFEKLKFAKVNDVNSEKSILFQKNNNLISVDNLSTGEKQIVFRGIYLLKNNNNLSGSICMIDEPELSMHPKWQQKIFSYYISLFKDGNNQKAQLLFATHSTEVLKNALKDKDNCLVIILKEENNIINSKRIDAPSVLPTITNAETNYLAFDVLSSDYHIELYGHLQNKENKRHIKECDKHIENHIKYNPNIHAKIYNHPNGRTIYNTLPTYIRNVIDHPDTNNTFIEDEFKKSIELLIELCR